MLKKIQWKRGAGVLFLSMTMCLLCVFLMILLMEFSNINFTRTVSTTRCDAIADSVAVYAQSYDYKYNQRQAENMLQLLTTYNNNASPAYELETTIQFPDEDVLKTTCKAKTEPYYPEIMGIDVVTVTNEATVKSVDIYGDIFVVPGDIAQEQHEGMTHTPTDVVPGSGDDIHTIE